MKKRVHYCNIKFTQEVIVEASNILLGYLTKDQLKKISSDFSVKIDGVTWEHDNDAEFFADYAKDIYYGYYYKSADYSEYVLSITFQDGCVDVAVKAPERHKVEAVHQVFEINAEKCKLPPKKDKHKKEPVIFLGHGRSNQWRDLKDHLQDKHGYKIEAYEVGARAGHTIRDILDEMLTKSSFALLVMTGEDKDEHGNIRARENVVHEIGLFQGKLGFPRAIVLMEEGTNEFSNIQGIQQIRFSKNNIKETFGEVLATLKREFKNIEA